MKKLIPIILTMLILLTACEANISDSFDNYLEKSDTYSNKALPSGAMLTNCNLNQDSNKYYTVLNFNVEFSDGDSYAWATLPQKEQKEDMKFIADMVMDYANSRDWDNDYYLYVAFETAYVSFVYDYETDTLYYPNNIGVYRLMYKDFNTIDPQELLNKENGEEFLIEHSLAKIKHKKIELYAPRATYMVYINNSRFDQTGFENSKTY